MRKYLTFGAFLLALSCLFSSCTKDDLTESLLAGTWQATYSSIDYGSEVKDRSDWVKDALIHFDLDGSGWSQDFLNYDVHLCTDDDASFFQHVEDKFHWSIQDGKLLITSSNKLVKTVTLDLLGSSKLNISYLLSDQYKVVVKGERTSDR